LFCTVERHFGGGVRSKSLPSRKVVMLKSGLVHGRGHLARDVAARKPSEFNQFEAPVGMQLIASSGTVSIRDCVPQRNAIFQFHLTPKVDGFWCQC
jgi:hypothetical protein